VAGGPGTPERDPVTAHPARGDGFDTVLARARALPAERYAGLREIAEAAALAEPAAEFRAAWTWCSPGSAPRWLTKSATHPDKIPDSREIVPSARAWSSSRGLLVGGVRG